MKYLLFKKYSQSSGLQNYFALFHCCPIPSLTLSFSFSKAFLLGSEIKHKIVCLKNPKREGIKRAADMHDLEWEEQLKLKAIMSSDSIIARVSLERDSEAGEEG
jgi:hypothetical protein